MQIPKLPRGPVIPSFNFTSDVEKIIKENEIKNQYKHNYKVALFSAICGGIMGFITSLTFWLISK